MKDITPERYKCGLGQDPGVFQLEDGRIAVRGPKVFFGDAAPSIEPLIDGFEAMVIIDPQMIADAMKELEGNGK